jgi:hypothetical protein
MEDKKYRETGEPETCSLEQFERIKYFYSQLLRVEDFEGEQKYLNEKRYLLNRLIHGVGLVCGLKVLEYKVENGKLWVKLSPGVALDCCGREIVVDKEGFFEVNGTWAEGNNCLYLKYKECLKGLVAAQANPSACEEVCCHSRTQETFELVLGNPPPALNVPLLLSPLEGSSVQASGVIFRWSSPQRAAEYEFTLATDQALINIVIQEVVTTAAYGPVNLDSNTNYWYAVRATEPSDSQQSVATFTTRGLMPLPAEEKITPGQQYYERYLQTCLTCTDPKVFLCAIKKEGDAFALDEATTGEYRSIVYNNPMLYNLLHCHLVDSNNPHHVTAGQTGALVSIDQLGNPGGDVDLEAGQGIIIEGFPSGQTGAAPKIKISAEKEVVTTGGGNTGVVNITIPKAAAKPKFVVERGILHHLETTLPPAVVLGLETKEKIIREEDFILQPQFATELAKECGEKTLPAVSFRALAIDDKKFDIMAMSTSTKEETIAVRWWAAPMVEEFLAPPVPEECELVPLPTHTGYKMALGTEITEFAISGDGMTIYAIDGKVKLNAAGAVYKSLDGGINWMPLPTISTSAGAIPVTNVAVAPDNPNIIAVSGGSDTSNIVDEVWMSNNGGTTWLKLPAPIGSAPTQRIMDLKVGPLPAGTTSGRDCLIATADNRAGNTSGGSLQIIGQTAAWVNVQAGGTADFTSCEFLPSYDGDRIVLGVGSNAGGTYLYTYNSRTPALEHAPVLLSSAIKDYDSAGAAGSILSSDIALPSDYDATDPVCERAYVGTASVPTINNDNVWRVSRTQSTAILGLNASVRSVAYSGTAAKGTLFVGEWSATGIVTQVRFTTDMTASRPVWIASFKPPTGNGGRAYVRVSPGFDSNSTVFCSTTGANESAFSVSRDGGVTYNQIAFIDNGVANDVFRIDSIVLTPDASTIFMATNDGADLSLWRSATIPTASSWERIFCATAAGPGRLAINVSGWASAPEIYLANSAAAVNGLYASYDGGSIFATRSLPLPGATFLSVASTKTVLVAIGNYVYKSTNGGWFWGLPVDAGAGAVNTVLPAPNGDILVGGSAGLTSISKDAGATFSPLQPGLNPAGNYAVIADEGYADNSILYAFDFAAGATSGVYRINVATDASWTNLAAPDGNVVGFGQSNGALYSMRSTACDRTLNPQSAVGEIIWEMMGRPAGVVRGRFSVANDCVYASDGITKLWFCRRLMTEEVPQGLQGPAVEPCVPVDPTTGRAEQITLTWSAMGTSQGPVNEYELWFAEADTNFKTPQTIIYTPPVATAPSITISGEGAIKLNAGTCYEWKIRSRRTVQGDLISGWSEVQKFCVCASPVTPPTPMLAAAPRATKRGKGKKRTKSK